MLSSAAAFASEKIPSAPLQKEQRISFLQFRTVQCLLKGISNQYQPAVYGLNFQKSLGRQNRPCLAE